MITTEKRNLSLNALSVSIGLHLLLCFQAYGLKLIEEAQVDFGAVHNARVLEHTFVFENDSEKACVIKHVALDCTTCTRVSLNSTYLAPGAMLEVKARLLTESLEGPVLKGIHLETDLSEHHYHVFLKAVVSPRFVQSRKPGEIVSITDDNEHSAKFTFLDKKGLEWADQTADSTAPWLQADLGQHRGGSGQEVHFTVDPEALESGLHQGVISFQAGEECFEMLIPVLAEKEYVLSPKSLTFRQRAEKQTGLVYYKAIHPKRLIKKVHIPNEMFKVLVHPEYRKGEYRIYVYGTGLEDYTNKVINVTIETVGTEFDDIILPVLIRP